jgi:hypothetical protein
MLVGDFLLLFCSVFPLPHDKDGKREIFFALPTLLFACLPKLHCDYVDNNG